MHSLLYIVFWVAVFLVLHTYVLFPLVVSILAKSKQLNQQVFKENDDLPFVTILMAAYNEEAVIEEKLLSLLAQTYPKDKLQIYIGSDNSSDSTNRILESYAYKFGFIHPTLFKSRQGKPKIINQLVSQVQKQRAQNIDHIYLMTDASVMLKPNALFQLVRHFKNEKIGLVDAHMTYTGMKQDGISKSENTYLNSEVILKQNESKLWGTMIGPFGGCFAMRASLYEAVPENYLVDDFYLAMKVLEKGFSVINDLDAICYEQVSHEMKEEIRRKKRISTGNFQNLFHFKHLLNPFTSIGFSFVSHKVLRWLGPFFMISILLSSLALAIQGSLFFGLVIVAQLIWYVVVPILDSFLRMIGFHWPLFRSVKYFNFMNWALLRGFFSFIGGVSSSIWEPTKRV